MNMQNVSVCKLIKIPKIEDPRGNLSVIENDVILNDGNDQKTVTLNKPFEGLLITNGIWRELKNFSSGSVCLVIASDVFKEEDYIRNFEVFFKSKN